MPPSVKIKVILSRTVDLLLMFILYTEEMQGTTHTTWQGNVLAVYEMRSYENGSEELYLTEQHIYGSNRLGMRKPNLLLAKSNEGLEIDLTMSSRALGEKRYELTNHLGNVLAVVSDKRLPNDEPDVISVSDYYPYGMLMPDRSYDAEEYRYGFNGKEDINELNGWQDYGERMYSPLIARFQSPDPIIAYGQQYPELSSYQFASNTPIWGVDLDGLEAYIAIETKGPGHVFLVIKTSDELIVQTYGRYGDIDWNRTSGEGVLVRLSGTDAIDYINKEMTGMKANFYKIKDITADNLKSITDAIYEAGTISKLNAINGKVIDTYSLFSSNCTTHSCDWLQDAGTTIFNQNKLGIEYKEDFVIPKSLENYIEEKMRLGNNSLSNANAEMKQIIINETAKQELQGTGITMEISGFSGNLSGDIVNSTSVGGSVGRNTTSGSSIGSSLGSSSFGPIGSSSGSIVGSSLGNAHSSTFK